MKPLIALFGVLSVTAAAQTLDVSGLYGQAFEQTMTPLTVAQAIATSAKSGKELVQVQGAITEVCQKAGCWVVLSQGTSVLRVKFQDHAFAVPKEVMGKQAVVVGQLSVKQLSNTMQQHLVAEDGASTASEQELTLVASGIQIL